MKIDYHQGALGFHFSEQPHLPLCDLFAVGHERVRSSYHWDGCWLFNWQLFHQGVPQAYRTNTRIFPIRQSYLALQSTFL
jgi:hypothetical protein